MSFDYFLLCSLISNNIGIIFCTILAFLMWFLNIFFIFFAKMRSNNGFFTNFAP
jgi:hypothetical protein